MKAEKHGHSQEEEWPSHKRATAVTAPFALRTLVCTP